MVRVRKRVGGVADDAEKESGGEVVGIGGKGDALLGWAGCNEEKVA